MLRTRFKKPIWWIVGVMLVLLFSSGCDTDQPDPTLPISTSTQTATVVAVVVPTMMGGTITPYIEPLATNIAPLSATPDATIEVDIGDQLVTGEPTMETTTERVAFRPIATLDPNQITQLPSTATPSPQPSVMATAESEPARHARILLADRPVMGEATLTALRTALNQTHTYIRTLNFLLIEAERHQQIDCNDFIAQYDGVAQSPTFTVTEQHALPYFHYSRTVELAIKRYSQLHLNCLQVVEQQGRGAATSATLADMPQSALDEAFNNRLDILTHSNDALLWLEVDDRVTLPLYRQVRSLIQMLRGILTNNPTTVACTELVEFYGEINRSPRLAPLVDTPQYYGYLWYLQAVESAELSGEAVVESCQTFLAAQPSSENATSVSTTGEPLDAESVAEALDGLRDGMNFIENAILALPTPTPEPTGIPVYAELLRTQPGQRDYLWEIVLQVWNVAGTPPYQALVGGFEMDEDHQITIVHTCQLDFVDHIILLDAVGQIFVSQKVTATRPPHCFAEGGAALPGAATPTSVAAPTGVATPTSAIVPTVETTPTATATPSADVPPTEVIPPTEVTPIGEATVPIALTPTAEVTPIVEATPAP